MENIEQLRKVATNAGKLDILLERKYPPTKSMELKLPEFYQEYSKSRPI